jgi:hypothetical protein
VRHLIDTDVFHSWLQSDVGDQLCLFARDEMITWLQARNRTWTVDLAFRTNVQVNIETIMKRIDTMGCKIEHEQVCYNDNIVRISICS